MIWLGLFLIAAGIYVQILRGGSPWLKPLVVAGGVLIVARLLQ